jgi:hypothetical protein
LEAGKSCRLPIRVARWHIFKQKSPIWVNFGGYSNGRCWYIICPLGLFYVYLVYFVAIRYIFVDIWYIFPVLVCCIDKNLATLLPIKTKFLSVDDI